MSLEDPTSRTDDCSLRSPQTNLLTFSTLCPARLHVTIDRDGTEVFSGDIEPPYNREPCGDVECVRSWQRIQTR
jgi:hypothetical protein